MIRKFCRSCRREHYFQAVPAQYACPEWCSETNVHRHVTPTRVAWQSLVMLVIVVAIL